MPFSEALKLQVKKMADFRCCRCREIGIDVHHIIPQAEGGSDDINNAAPLCQNCHDRFGANPEKRKEIRQMRDFWYELVQERHYSDQSRFEKLNETLLKIQHTQTQAASKTEVDELRTVVINELKSVRKSQEQAIELLKSVPVPDIPRVANTAVSASVVGSFDLHWNPPKGGGRY
jgi:HNH endonuclease